MKNKKEKIIAILLVVGLIVVTASISYAAFRFSGLGSKVNTITTGSITMSYTESSNVLSMSGALPTTDATGTKRLNPGEYFDFTVSSSIKGDTNINYEIAVEELDGSTMSGDFIKFYLTKVDAQGNEEEVMAPSTYSAETESNTYTGRPANMMSLYTSSMTASETTTYRLRMYVSEEYNPQGDGGNLTYKARVNVYGLTGDKVENGEEESVALAAGIYDREGNMTESWQELIDAGIVEVNDGVLTTNKDEDGMTPISGYLLIIDESVTSIGDDAFYEAPNLYSVVMPNSVTSIGTYAFSYAYALESIILSENLETIGQYAFADTDLHSITIPNSVINIDSLAFDHCDNLTVINFAGTTDEWNNISFSESWNAYCPEITVHCTNGDIMIPAF